MTFDHYLAYAGLAAVVLAVLYRMRAGGKVAMPSMPSVSRAFAPAPKDPMQIARDAMRAAHEALQEAGLMRSIGEATEIASDGYAADHRQRLSPLVGATSAPDRPPPDRPPPKASASK